MYSFITPSVPGINCVSTLILNTLKQLLKLNEFIDIHIHTNILYTGLRVYLRIAYLVIISASKRKAWTFTHGGITRESHSPAHCASIQHRTGNCCCATHANTTPLRTLLYSGRGVRRLLKELEPLNNTAVCSVCSKKN